MNFQTLCQYLVTELSPDGDTPFTLPDSAPYFSTPFGVRVDLLLKRFSKDAYLLFTPRVEITLSPDDWEFDFSDPNNCDLALFDVQRIYIANERITRYQGAQTILGRWRPEDPAGRPTAFAPLSDYKILFDCVCDDAIDDCFAQGFYRHPTITADTGAGSEVLMPDEMADLFARYAAAFLRSNVASDEVGLNRLARLDSAAAQGVRDLKNKSLIRMMQGGRS